MGGNRVIPNPEVASVATTGTIGKTIANSAIIKCTNFIERVDAAALAEKGNFIFQKRDATWKNHHRASCNKV